MFKSSKSENLLFTDSIDTSTDEAMVEEMYWSMIQRFDMYILDLSEEKNIYGEPSAEPTYTLLTPQIPIQIKLNPEEEELNKYGYDRTRDAIIWFSTKILRDLGISPKVGDRINFTFTNEVGAHVIEHLEIHEISPWDFARQAKWPYQINAGADRTQKAMKP